MFNRLGWEKTLQFTTPVQDRGGYSNKSPSGLLESFASLKGFNVNNPGCKPGL
jgi:hypothetical protein